MLALSIRQPFAELILRGIKTVEYRSRATKVIGERFWIYASKGSGVGVQGSGKRIWSGDLSEAKDLPAWMIELAEQVKMIPPGTVLPTGVIVGSAVVERCDQIGVERRSDEATQGEENALVPFPSSLRGSVASSLFRWHLTDIQRATRLRKPTNHPQPVWFRPF